MYFNQKQSNHLNRSNLIVLGLSFGLSSCVAGRVSPNSKGIAGGTSKISEVQMKVPASDALTTPDGKKPVTGLHLQITPVDSTCTGATKVDQIINIQGSISVQQRVAKGCAYDVRVELGQLDPSSGTSSSLSEIYYAPAAPARITTEMTNDAKISLKVSLSITDAGRNIGLPDGGSISPPPSPNPPSPPSNQLADLPSNINVTVKGLSGNFKLQEIFTTEYLVVDFSRPGCGYCVELTKSLESDKSFQSAVSGKKCRAMTILPANQLSDWTDIFGGSDTFAAKHSYEYAKSLSGFGQLFGLDSMPTPTFIIIDRSGKIMDQAEDEFLLN